VSPISVLPAAGLDAHVADWLDVGCAAGFDLVSDQDRAFSLDDLAQRWADRADGEPRHLVGCSLGAMVAVHVALRFPGLVRSLVLVAAPAETDADMLEQRARATEERGAPGMVAETLERWFSPDVLDRNEPPVAYARARLTAIDTDALAATWRAMAHLDVVDALSDVRVPTLCVAGDHDPAAPPESMLGYFRGIAGSRMEVVRGAHLLPLESPAELSRCIREHLARLG
jgi:3-oxoadipate enol-lactonase